MPEISKGTLCDFSNIIHLKIKPNKSYLFSTPSSSHKKCLPICYHNQILLNHRLQYTYPAAFVSSLIFQTIWFCVFSQHHPNDWKEILETVKGGIAPYHHQLVSKKNGTFLLYKDEFTKILRPCYCLWEKKLNNITSFLTLFWNNFLPTTWYWLQIEFQPASPQSRISPKSLSQEFSQHFFFLLPKDHHLRPDIRMIEAIFLIFLKDFFRSLFGICRYLINSQKLILHLPNPL